MALRISTTKNSEKYGNITSTAHWLLDIITVEVNHKCCCGYLHVMFGFKIACVFYFLIQFYSTFFEETLFLVPVLSLLEIVVPVIYVFSFLVFFSFSLS